MEYIYLGGVVLILFFALMFVTEQMWLKNVQTKSVAPPEPARAVKAAARPEIQPKDKPRTKKGRKR